MNFLAKIHEASWTEPQIFHLPQDVDKIEDLDARGNINAVYDQVHLAVSELYDIKFPEQKDSRDNSQYNNFISEYGNLDHYGAWVWYPWSKNLVHFPPRDDLRALRTSRNRNLITAQEQKKLYGGTIAIFGLSVGSNIVEALLSQGIGGKLIIVDMDILEPSNLNRIRAEYHRVGAHKVDVIAEKISEIDPYVQQVHYKNGLDETSLAEIIEMHAPDILIDEMDSVAMKLKVRYQAKEHGLPVLMAADDGDSILLDVERYDKKNDLPILHGNIPQEVIDHILSDPNIPRPELGKLIGKFFVGLENVPLRMFQSLSEVGKSLPSWPQLGGAAALAGITIAYCSKKILLDQPLNDGRFLVGPDEQLNPEVHDPEYIRQLEDIRKKISS